MSFAASWVVSLSGPRWPPPSVVGPTSERYTGALDFAVIRVAPHRGRYPALRLARDDRELEPRDRGGLKIEDFLGFAIPTDSMYFSLIDRITHLEPGSSIRTLKALSLAEEYLQDHFPRFPVMPGVLMLEAMYQTSAWLIRASEDFAHSTIVLKEARNVRYGGFVQPGQTLAISAEIIKHDDATTSLKAQGELEGQVAVSARLVLERYNLSQRSAEPPELDEHLRCRFREIFRLLYPRPNQVAEPSTAK